MVSAAGSELVRHLPLRRVSKQVIFRQFRRLTT